MCSLQLKRFTCGMYSTLQVRRHSTASLRAPPPTIRCQTTQLRHAATAVRQEETWQRQLSAFLNFISFYERYPSHLSENRDESKLAFWLSNNRRIRTKLQKGNLGRYNALVQHGLIYPDETDDEWLCSFTKAHVFVTKNGRSPDKASPSMYERQLGAWVSIQRGDIRSLKNMYPQRYKMLKEAHDKGRGWWKWSEGRFAPRLDWQIMYDKTNAFLSEHGRWPRRRIPDANERQLADWVYIQRRNKKKLPKHRYESLNNAPWWSWEFRTQEVTWLQTIDAVGTFVADNDGRWPSQHSKNAHERRLGKWVMHQRANKDTLIAAYPQRDKEFNSRRWWKWKDWDKLWEFRLQALDEFYKEHARLPKQKENPRLYQWLYRQRKGIAQLKSRRRDNWGALHSREWWTWGDGD